MAKFIVLSGSIKHGRSSARARRSTSRPRKPRALTRRGPSSTKATSVRDARLGERHAEGDRRGGRAEGGRGAGAGAARGRREGREGLEVEEGGRQVKRALFVVLGLVLVASVAVARRRHQAAGPVGLPRGIWVGTSVAPAGTRWRVSSAAPLMGLPSRWWVQGHGPHHRDWCSEGRPLLHRVRPKATCRRAWVGLTPSASVSAANAAILRVSDNGVLINATCGSASWVGGSPRSPGSLAAGRPPSSEPHHARPRHRHGPHARRDARRGGTAGQRPLSHARLYRCTCGFSNDPRHKPDDLF